MAEAAPRLIAWAEGLLSVSVLLLPLCVLVTASLKLWHLPDHRVIHIGLALTSGLASLLVARFWAFPGSAPTTWQGHLLGTWTLLCLYAWMAFDFLRSLRRTRLTFWATDAPVLLCVLGMILGVAIALLHGVITGEALALPLLQEPQS